MTTYRLPLRLAYQGAATIEDSEGSTVAECRDPETARRLVDVVNTALNYWNVSASESSTEEAMILAMAGMIRALDLLHKGDL